MLIIFLNDSRAMAVIVDMINLNKDKEADQANKEPMKNFQAY